MWLTIILMKIEKINLIQNINKNYNIISMIHKLHWSSKKKEKRLNCNSTLNLRKCNKTGNAIQRNPLAHNKSFLTWNVCQDVLSSSELQFTISSSCHSDLSVWFVFLSFCGRRLQWSVQSNASDLSKNPTADWVLRGERAGWPEKRVLEQAPAWTWAVTPGSRGRLWRMSVSSRGHCVLWRWTAQANQHLMKRDLWPLTSSDCSNEANRTAGRCQTLR